MSVLARVAVAAGNVARAEERLAEARDALAEAVRVAVDAGATFRQAGEAAGLTAAGAQHVYRRAKREAA